MKFILKFVFYKTVLTSELSIYIHIVNENENAQYLIYLCTDKKQHISTEKMNELLKSEVEFKKFILQDCS